MRFASLRYASILGVCCAKALAADYDEGVSGDLSNDRLAPTVFALTGLNNVLAGSVNLGDRDYFTIQVPAGFSLSEIVQQDFVSNNARAFIGFQVGDTFTVAPQNATPDQLSGYVHFGLDFPMPTSILDDMNQPDAIGFIAPLQSGNYTFWINQTEPQLAAYQFNFVLVPEPALLGTAMLGLVLVTRRRR